MMGMEQSLIIRQRQIQTQQCVICGAFVGHNPGCPIEEIKELSQRNRHIECPNCNRKEIGLNRKDVYECRICHTQYCRRPIGSCVGEEVLDDPGEKDMCMVYVLKEKGNGDFPIDKAIEEIKKQIKQIKKARKPRKHKS